MGKRMRRVDTADLLPGMITAEDVYNYNNQLILPKGLILNDQTITKLTFYSIIQVKVEDESVETATSSAPYELSYSERIRTSPEFIKFRSEFTTDVDNFRHVIKYMVFRI